MPWLLVFIALMLTRAIAAAQAPPPTSGAGEAPDAGAPDGTLSPTSPPAEVRAASPPQPPPPSSPAPASASSRPSPALAPDKRLALSGYIQAQWNQPVDANDDGMVAKNTFLVRRLRLRAKGEVVRGVGYTVMIDASTPSNLLRDGFVALTFVPHHELRVGQQKTQFGYENPESATRLYTVNRAFASDALARGPDLRDIGLGLLGDWKLFAGLGLDYQLTLVNGSGPNQPQDDTDRKSFWGRAGLSWRHDRPVLARIGGSFATGDQLRKAPATDPMAAPVRRAHADLDGEGTVEIERRDRRVAEVEDEVVGLGQARAEVADGGGLADAGVGDEDAEAGIAAQARERLVEARVRRPGGGGWRGCRARRRWSG